jgi:16S rRNA C1402 (ribose-2'-O) methylase RsmI
VVNYLRQAGIKVVPIPGVSAVVTALSVMPQGTI